MGLNMEFLIERIWEELALIRVYTKRRGEMPDFSGPIIMRGDSTVKDVVSLTFLSFVVDNTAIAEKTHQRVIQCNAIHRTLSSEFKSALVWV
jgi:ribosome-interacting GTPase 1